MNMVDNPMIGKLGRYLDVASFRQSVVAGNMANVDTPGYRTRDIDFSGELKRQQSGPAVAREVSGLIERPDGNNVNIDRESMAIAETQLQFRLGVQLLRTEFRRMLTAINEGR